MTVVPLLYGATPVQHPKALNLFRRFWCSFDFAFAFIQASNESDFYFLIPDSIQPWFMCC